MVGVSPAANQQQARRATSRPTWWLLSSAGSGLPAKHRFAAFDPHPKASLCRTCAFVSLHQLNAACRTRPHVWYINLLGSHTTTMTLSCTACCAPCLDIILHCLLCTLFGHRKARVHANGQDFELV